MKQKIFFLIGLSILFIFLIYLFKPDLKTQAINSVKSLPEIQNYLKNDRNNSFVKTEARGEFFAVQVGAINQNHTTTFNWYKVDRKGKIVCSMFNYDKNGKFLGSGETKGICIQ